MATKSFRDVELVRTGTWAASTGVTTIKREDLEAMLEAASDAEVDRAPIRLGHIDPRFDGEPALGWVTNLRIVDRSTYSILVGDIVDVPAKLASVIPKAFKRRSVEIAWGVRTPAGNRYRAALTGLALLGVAPPAVKGLDDLVALYGESLDRRSGPVTSSIELTVTSSSSLAQGDELDQPDVAKALTALAAATNTTPTAILAALAGAGLPGDTAEARDNGPNRATDPSEEATPMDDKRLRELLELEEGADVEAAVTALKTKAKVEETSTEETKVEPDGTETETSTEETKVEPAPTAEEPELVKLSSGQWSEVQSKLAEFDKVLEERRASKVAGAIRSALSTGRIAPADVDKWKGRLEADLEGTESLLSSLTPAFPVSELGSANALELEPDEAAWSTFEAEVFGLESDRRTR